MAEPHRSIKLTTRNDEVHFAKSGTRISLKLHG